jgi:hypothetical protein
VSQSSATKLTGSFALPGPPADAPENAHTERVRAAQATLGAEEGDVSTDEPAPPPGEQLPLNFLNNAHDRSFPRRMHLQRPKNAPTEGAAVGDLSAFFNQQIAFNQIVSGGALVASGGAFVQANGYTQAWDNCSDTPVRRPGVSVLRAPAADAISHSSSSTRRARRSSRTMTRTRLATRPRSRRAAAWLAASRGRSIRCVLSSESCGSEC